MITFLLAFERVIVGFPVPLEVLHLRRALKNEENMRKYLESTIIR